MNKRKGSRPTDGVLLAETTGFELWACGNVAPDALWQKLKLVALDPDPVKANWWLSWNRVEGRMARGKDWGLLREHRPSVSDWVEAVCRKGVAG